MVSIRVTVPPIAIESRQGTAYLPELDLWLDPRRKKDLAFVSHAHSDHYAPNTGTICSRGTRRLIEARYSTKRTSFRELDFGEDMTLAGHRLRLLPAGHIAGSAQLLVERLADGATLLYTGDFKIRPGHAAEPAEWRQVDTLVMETTFGLPRYRLPRSDEVVAAMAGFARQSLADGHAPMFLAYSLGKAQEALLALHRAAPELVFAVHPAVAEMTRAVAGLGWEFPDFLTFDPKKSDQYPAGHVVIQPPTGRRIAAPGVRTAMVTGWAIDSSTRYRHRVDAAFALSDHADYDDLLSCVENRVRPRRIITLHGYAREFAADLRSRGWDAWSLEGGDQLEMPLFSVESARSGRD